ncbi:MAG: hypothetical protein HY699_11820 [Deltaproteobacteria bacterium]|nr:hypothetical protein [Deltaproteobacteria bacterium]
MTSKIRGRASAGRMHPGSVIMLALFLGSRIAAADVTSDSAAAIVVYPVILVAGDNCVDTLVQLSNTSSESVIARCFYVNATGRCSTTGQVCFSGAQCPGGICLPQWRETDFNVRLTPRQPLTWLASEGLSAFCTPTQTPGERCIPLNGTSRRGTNGASNAGTRIPPVNDDPFIGELKCIAVDEQYRPTDRNVLVGSATIEEVCRDCLDVTRHNAIGIQAVVGANNGDNTLVIGEEYNACPHTLIVNHYFDGATSPVTGDPIFGALALVPCSEDFVMQDRNLTPITAQFLVFNEFEQRLSASTSVQCYASFPLSGIDTTQPTRSIFHVGVAGSLVGQTRVHGVGTGGHGLLGAYFDLHGSHSSAANLHFQGTSDRPDIIRLP